MHFIKGAQIEVINAAQEHPQNFTATVIKPLSNKRQKLLVEYHTLYENSSDIPQKRLQEDVDLVNVRPMQPMELNRCYKVDDVVDALHCNGWCKGVVKNILENSKYLVGVQFEGSEKEVVFDQWSLRVHREWKSDSWVPPIQSFDGRHDHAQQQQWQQEQAKKENDLVAEPTKKRVKFIFSKQMKDMKFSHSQLVEVCNDEEGYQGAWYAAKVVAYFGNNKYMVEYITLRTDDKTMPLREVTYGQYIRPCPPLNRSTVHYTPHDEVDVWYNDGWWKGEVLKVLSASRYAVYFSSTNETLIFKHHDLRPHFDWIDEKWISASERKSVHLDQTSTKLKGKKKGGRGERYEDFEKGMKVEVKSDEVGYKGSWWSATIVGRKRKDIYLVEYDNLMTDDETGLLKEEIAGSYIRPRPPEVQHQHPFRINQQVDAWYNDGWWEGSICKVLGDTKYAVYFETSAEVLEFEHGDLRPHQELKNGEWISSTGIRNH